MKPKITGLLCVFFSAKVIWLACAERGAVISGWSLNVLHLAVKAAPDLDLSLYLAEKIVSEVSFM